MSEFNIEARSYKRGQTHFITLEVTNTLEEDLVSENDHKVNLRPRWVKAEDTIIHDPDFGRVDSVENIQAGKKYTFKTKIYEKDLPGDSEEYEFAYGIVQEFKQWHEDFGYVTIKVKKD